MSVPNNEMPHWAVTATALALFTAIYSGGLGVLYIVQHIAGGAA